MKIPEFSPIVKRTNYTVIDRILAYVQIELTFKHRMTKWIYGGNYEIYDDFESGYTVQLSLEYNDAKIRKILVKILREHNFGCLISEYGAIGHKNDDTPTKDESIKILDAIQSKINQSKLEYSEPQWTRLTWCGVSRGNSKRNLCELPRFLY